MKIYILKDDSNDYEYDSIIGRFSSLELALSAKENIEEYIRIISHLKEIKEKLEFDYKVFKNDYSINFPEPIYPEKPIKHPESLLKSFISAKDKFLKEGNTKQAEIYNKNYQDLCEENRRSNIQYNLDLEKYSIDYSIWEESMNKSFYEYLNEKQKTILKMNFNNYELPLEIEEYDIDDFQKFDLSFYK